MEIDVTLNELKELLKNKGFEVKEEYDLNGVYMINKNDKKDNNFLELLKKCVLVRNVIEKNINLQI